MCLTEKMCVCGFSNVCFDAYLCICLFEIEKTERREIKAKEDVFTQGEMMQRALAGTKVLPLDEETIPSPGNTDQSGFK